MDNLQNGIDKREKNAILTDSVACAKAFGFLPQHSIIICKFQSERMRLQSRGQCACFRDCPYFWLFSFVRKRKPMFADAKEKWNL